MFGSTIDFVRNVLIFMFYLQIKLSETTSLSRMRNFKGSLPEQSYFFPVIPEKEPLIKRRQAWLHHKKMTALNHDVSINNNNIIKRGEDKPYVVIFRQHNTPPKGKHLSFGWKE